jgi:site-specific recombinase XerD
MYLHYIEKFLDSIDINIQRINSNDFQSYLYNYNFTSISQQNQVINAIRFLYKFGLNKKYDKVSFKRPKSEKKLPQVIDGEYIKERLSKITNLKHKVLLSLTYSVGLRVSEVINLKIEDIDSKRMIIHIKNAKGRKDRVVPLSQKVLELLREYFKQYRNNNKDQLKSKSNQIIQCSNCDKSYRKKSKSIHVRTKYCKNYKSTTSESSTESIINSDTDVE